MQATRWTIFNTPVVSTVLHGVAVLLLRLFGWRTDGVVPDEPKFVVVGAPHTSNWDLPLAVMFAFAYDRRIFWLGKETLFRPLHGWFFRWLGGIRVDRSQRHGAVGQAVKTFNESDELILVIAPEGTRKRVKHWKSGFYHIALGAKAPILLACLDYGRKVGGLGPLITPTGDFAADMRPIRDYYAGIIPKNPDLAGLPDIAPEE